MIYTGEKITLNTFIYESKDNLKNNAIRQANNHGITEENYNDYLVINVEGYYNIVKIIDEWEPIKIDDTVYPFDENKIYPMQRIEQKIRYIY